MQPNSRTIALFWQNVDKRDPGECWPWLGRRTPQRYGVMCQGQAHLLAHRVAYFLAYGPISPHRVIHHSCRNRLCMNPAHLVCLTMGEHSIITHTDRAVTATRTHCKHGQEFTPENTYITKKGSRACRACHRVWGREFYREHIAPFRQQVAPPDRCQRGHPYTPENTRRRPDGRRVCRECARMRARKYSRLRKLVAA